MARTAFYAPAHRVMGRVPSGGTRASQPPTIAPSADAVGSGVQDARYRWNNGSSTTAPEVLMWMNPGAYPVIDAVPATASNAALAAAQVPVAGTPLTLIPASGAGAVVPTTTTLMYPSGVVIPTTARFIHAVPIYRQFGFSKQQAWAYDADSMLERAVRVFSVGADTGATATVTGFDSYGYTIRQTMTMAGAGAAVTTTKCYKGIYSVVCAGTLSGSNVSVGFADVIGLPMYAPAAQAIWGFWNNLIITGTGTFVAGVTSTSSASTGDVNGTYLPGSAADGTKRLQVWMHPDMPSMITSGINIGMFGVAEF
jgi:hypothetical protein